MLGGQRSTCWYNGAIYANAITRGLYVFALSGVAHAQPRRLAYDNPQTQEALIP